MQTPIQTRLRALLPALILALPLDAAAQQGEIFIPGASDSAAPVELPRPQNRLAGCLANPGAATCTGVEVDPGGLALESATAVPSVQFETLVLDLNAGQVQAKPEPPAKAPDYAAPVPRAARVELPSVAITIAFDFDSARIRADQLGKIGSLVDAFRDPALAGTTYAVIGHTDAKGAAGYNCDLSRRRAAEVTAALQANYVTLQLYPVGFGEHVLKNSQDPNAAENRRVTFLRLPSEASAVLQTAAAVCDY